MPGLSRVLSSVQFLNHYAPVIKITIDELINAKVPIAKNTAITNKDGINSQFKFEKFFFFDLIFFKSSLINSFNDFERPLILFIEIFFFEVLDIISI